MKRNTCLIAILIWKIVLSQKVAKSQIFIIFNLYYNCQPFTTSLHLRINYFPSVHCLICHSSAKLYQRRAALNATLHVKLNMAFEHGGVMAPLMPFKCCSDFSVLYCSLFKLPSEDIFVSFIFTRWVIIFEWNPRFLSRLPCCSNTLLGSF